MRPTFRVYRDAGEEWRWTLLAGNGEPVASSESYSRAADAVRGARAARRAALSARVTLAYDRVPLDDLLQPDEEELP